MANNNSGYPYQYHDQRGWPPNYSQQQGQLLSQNQGQPQNQQMRMHQYSQPNVQQYPPPSPQMFSHVNPPPSPQQMYMQQQYQYRSTQPADMHYPQGPPQFDGNGSPYSQGRQVYSSPHGQYPPFTNQQQHNQYAQAQNQRIQSLPQRQLSYSQSQHYQIPSPQPSRGSMPSSPQVTVHNFQAQVPTGNDQTLRTLPSSAPYVGRQMQSQSPAPQLQRKSLTPVLPNDQSGFEKLQIHSPIVQPRPQQPATISKGAHIATNLKKSQSPSIQTLPSPLVRPQTITPDIASMSRTSDIGQISRKPSSKMEINHHSPALTAISEKPKKPGITVPEIDTINKSNRQLEAPPVQVQKQTVKPKQHPSVKREPFDVREAMVPPRDQKPQTTIKVKPEDHGNTKVKQESAEEPSRPITEIDYAMLLIDLAEEYFDSAYGKSNQGKPARREKDLNVFYKLIATGLGCLEVVLKQWRSALQPAVEAAVRLRYASILYEETTNTSEAEEVLSKGISQCDKLRLVNLKYNMHHLLARVTFTTNPKAAIKYVATVIKEAEIQDHVPWIYAFRFLSASLSLETQSTHEALQALSQLKHILTQAKSRGDIAVAATASAVEAMAHIARAHSSEAIEQAQTALATVRSAENNPNVSKIPQLIIMAHFVDLMCSLYKADTDTAHKKMKAMHMSMDELADHSSWTTDDTFMIPIGQQSAKANTGNSAYGVVVSQQEERTYLKMGWMPKNELYALGNMLGAATLMHKASSDKKCEEFLDNAEAFLKVGETMSSSVKQSMQHEDLLCHLQVLRVFGSCSRNAWSDAKKQLNSLKVKMAGMEDAAKTSLPAFIIYLEAMIAQGTGNTATALVLYNNPVLSLTNDNNTAARQSPIIHDLSVLATLNTILIIHRPGHPQHHRMEGLLAALDGLDTANPSGNMRGAYFLIRALQSDSSTDPSTNPILNTKTNLREVLQIAKQTGNSQFSCISLTFMTDRFFKGQVGEQAHKSASTALNLARRGKNDLWTSVAEGLLAACLETRGDTAEATTRRSEAVNLAMRLPASMQISDNGFGEDSEMSL